MDITVRKPWLDDCEHIAERMRQADIDEVAASHAYSPDKATLLSTSYSDESYVAVAADGEPIALFGVAAGSPWLLGTDRVAEIPLTLVREGRRYANKWLTKYGPLSNYVHHKNIRSIQWLEAIGFAIHPPVPYGPGGELFHPFTKTR